MKLTLGALQQQSQPPLPPEAQELLAQLRDIHEPAPVSWWPPAPGWWLLALLLLLCAVAAFFWLRRRRRQRQQNRYRDEAVRLLVNINTNDARAAQVINEILKRAAVTSYGRTACGNLTGRRWLDFLKSTAAVDCPIQAQKVLLEKLYRLDNVDTVGNQEFRDYAISWVQEHGKRSSHSALAEMEAENV